MGTQDMIHLGIEVLNKKVAMLWKDGRLLPQLFWAWVIKAIKTQEGWTDKIYSPVVKSISELSKSIGQAITVVKNWNSNRATIHHRILWHLWFM